MEKLERNGKIAVLVSHGFGAGWSTWNSDFAETLCMDKRIVEAVLADDLNGAALLAEEICGEEVYTGGATGLRVEWVDKGAMFEIEASDGSETLHIICGRDYLRAQLTQGNVNMKKMKITVVSPEQMQEEGFRNPSKYYFVNALGENVFLHTRDRQEATQYVKDEYGGKYNIRTSSDEKVKGEVSCRGFANSKSKSGTFIKNLHNGQGRGI